jgi:hypothetical protein
MLIKPTRRDIAKFGNIAEHARRVLRDESGQFILRRDQPEPPDPPDPPDPPNPPVTGRIFLIPHQTMSAGNTTWPLIYGANLASSLNMVRDPDDCEGPNNGSNLYQMAHLAGQGYNGTNCLQFTRWPNINGDPDTGFEFNPTTIAPVGGWRNKALVSPLFIRFRVFWTAPLTLGANSSAQMKWFIFGGPGITGTRRMIASWYRASDPSYGAGGNDNTQVSYTCTAGVSGNHCQILVNINTWSHIQTGWRYNEAGSPYIRIWRNNNNQASPTAQHTAFNADGMGGSWPAPESWEGGHWADTVSTNSFTGTTAQFRIQDMEFGDTFDPGWFPQ